MHSLFSSVKVSLSIFIFALLGISTSVAQTIVINELSNGPSGAKEYVELLVVGTPDCSGIPTLDMRSYYIDDNNGTFAGGGGTGIAGGCMRFRNTAFWQAIPVGTLIVIYNDQDVNASIPAQDLSMTDGNCRLIIASNNCTLLETNSSGPNSSSSSYPTSGFTSCGDWNTTSMANTADSYQIRNASGALLHSVSYGNNTNNNIIYFSGAGGGNVYRMMNGTSNNPSLQSNWVQTTTAGNESPGSPNNAANASWINSMNNSCSAITPIVLSVSSTTSGCTCNGTATVNASGGIQPYTYSWTGNTQTSATLTGACAGIYTVTVTDNRGCSETTTVSVGASAGFLSSVTTTSISCSGGNNGSATVVLVGGAAPFNYNWSSGGTNTTENNLAAGTYTVDISDNNACTGSVVFEIAEPAILDATFTSSDTKCFGSNDGTASINPSGGTGAYTYNWLPVGGSSSSNNNLSAGNYTVEIKDANNCQTNKTFTISQPTAITTTNSTTNESCDLNNGTASINPSGGIPGYTFLWSTGETSSTATSLSSGTHTVTITDQNQCASTVQVVVNSTSGPSLTLSQSNITCNGLSDGSASVIANGGTPGYSYLWQPSGSIISNPINLSAGTHSLTVTDALGCITTGSVIITEPAIISLTINNGTICVGQSITLSAEITGGQQPYTYNWDSGTSTNTSFIVSPTATTTYSLQITDNAGCVSSISTSTIIVRDPISIASIPNDTLCTGNSTTLTAIVQGGDGTYSYNWMPGNLSGQNIQVSPTITTNYTVSVSDGCTTLDATQTANVVLFTFPPITFVTDTLTACLPICINFFNTTAISSSNISSVSWNFGDHSSSNLLQPIHCYTTAGNFQPSLTISSNDGCTVTGVAPFTIAIVEQPKAIISLSSNEVSLDESTIDLANNSMFATSIEWLNYNGQTFSTESITIHYEEEGFFPISLIATNNLGCTDTATEIISVKPGFTFYIPNSFTPDGDKFNKTFSALGMGWNEKNYSFDIYNRWGEKIFSTTNINDAWDGTFKGKPAQIDTYVWKIVVFDSFMNEHSHSGKVNLIR